MAVIQRSVELLRSWRREQSPGRFGNNSFLIIEGAGRLDRITVKGDTFSVETLKDGLVGPTSVAQVGKTGWVSEGQLDFLFDPVKKGQAPTLPFRMYPVPLP